MSNKPTIPAHLLAAAQEDIFQPYKDRGLTFLGAPDWIWKTIPAPRVMAHAVSAWPEQQAVLAAEVDRINYNPARHCVIYNQSAVHVADAQVEDMITINKKQLVMFRKKMRARNTYRKIMADYIKTEQASYTADPPELPLSGVPDLGTLDSKSQMRIPLPGMQNYFHGIWENLPQFVLADDANFKGRIICRTPLPELPKFAQDFLELLFPDLVDQIDIQRATPGPDFIKSRRCRDFYTGFDWAFYAHLVPGLDVDIGLPHALSDLDVFYRSDAFAFFFNFANSATINQMRFRDRAVATVRDMNTQHLPRRVFISRKGSSRRPQMRGEAELLAELKPLGFEEVQLETLNVAEQIALFNTAEIVIGQHGAGTTNMMFASPDTTMIEIGHGQTIERWRTFHPMAAVSGCRFEAFFADYDIDTPTKRPNMRTEGFPVPHCTPEAIDLIMARMDMLVGETG